MLSSQLSEHDDDSDYDEDSSSESMRNMKLFFSVQLGHLKLSGYGLLSTQGVQNRSQNCRSISQSDNMLQYVRDPGAPAVSRPKGVKTMEALVQLGENHTHGWRGI